MQEIKVRESGRRKQEVTNGPSQTSEVSCGKGNSQSSEKAARSVASCTSDSRLVSNVHKELKKPNIKETNYLTESGLRN